MASSPAHELAAQGLAFRHRHESVAAHLLEARQKGEIECRDTHGRGRHLVDEMHECSHSRACNRIFGRKAAIGRYLIEVFRYDRRIDDDRAIMVERGHDAVGIEFEVVGLELVALKQIELHLVERQFLGVEDEPNTLAA